MLSKLHQSTNISSGDEDERRDVRERDAGRTLTAWREFTKRDLVLACTHYHLDATGTKKIMAHRLYCHFRPASSASTSTGRQLGPGVEEEASSTPQCEEPFTRSSATPSQRRPDQPIVQVSLEELGTLVKDAVSAAMLSRDQVQSPSSRPATQHAEPASQPVPPLSPSSFAPFYPQRSNQEQNGDIVHAAASFMAHGEEAGSASARQETGMESSTLPANLPPISGKIHKAIKAREFIDFNSLLPQSLYDLASENQLVDFQIIPGKKEQETFSLAPKKRPSQRITNFSSWLEAWNIFVRVTIHYHPRLAADLLTYQENICQISRNYPFNAWQRYDTAFRLNLALNKSLSWARTDSYSFDKFLRDSRAQQQPGLCFKCQLPGHLASDCPSFQRFRPKQAIPAANPTTKGQIPCRHYNNRGNCFQKYCSFAHKCSRPGCGGNHPGTDCPGAAKHL
eukprot:Seg1809.3 transcript_id=Seg1809.3/GoldUCD/mRNA.D3Y31 product="hypothetical protein" protein_id=Seg1809.3/GoldUCD/D3Y31